MIVQIVFSDIKKKTINGYSQKVRGTFYKERTTFYK